MGEVETVVIYSLRVSISRHKNSQSVVAGKAEKKRPTNLFLEFQLEVECPSPVRTSPFVPVKIEGAGPA